MTKNDAIESFKSDVLPSLRLKDVTAIRTAWNDYVDGLEKSGQITQKQSYIWTNPVVATWRESII